MLDEEKIVVDLLTALRSYATGLATTPELAQSVLKEWEEFIKEKDAA